MPTAARRAVPSSENSSSWESNKFMMASQPTPPQK